MEAPGQKPAAWVYEMLESGGKKSFYELEIEYKKNIMISIPSPIKIYQGLRALSYLDKVIEREQNCLEK